MDIPAFTKGTRNFTTGTTNKITNASGVITNYATQITFAPVAGSNDIFIAIVPLTAATKGTVLLFKMWIKLGTATNVCIVPNNGAAWDTKPGAKSYTAIDGLNNRTYTLITHVFTSPTTNVMSKHLGATGQAGFPQTAGYVFAYGFQLKLRDLTSVLDGSLTTLGNTTASGNLAVVGTTTLTGNVGIGTVSPESALVVSGTKATTPTTVGIHIGADSGLVAAIERCPASAANVAYIDFTYPMDFRGRIMYNNATNVMSFATNASASAQLNILSTGNVGINTTAPTSALHVVGTGNITGNVAVGGTLTSTGLLTASGNQANVGTLTSTGNTTVGGTLTSTGLMTATGGVSSTLPIGTTDLMRAGTGLYSNSIRPDTGQSITL